MKEKIKRGEITTAQLVTIIILILSFAVILFLIFRLDLGSTSKSEICRNSVLLKDKSGIGGHLDCQTQYLCIGGSCEGDSSVKEIEANTKEEVFGALAKEMEQCWWQFGEGKIDYSTGESFKSNQCAVCSTIKFDSGLNEQLPLSYSDLYIYLSSNQKSKSQTYSQYLYASNDFSNFSSQPPFENYFNNTFENGKEYFILTGIVKEGFISTWKNPFNPPFDSYPVIILEDTPENYGSIGCDQFITRA